MAFEYIGDLLEEAVRDVNPLETRGRVEQVVGTIIRAVVPGVKVGELCLLRNPWENWSLKAEVVGFVRNVALLSPLGNMQGISPATEVIPTGEILSVPVGYELLGRVVDGLGQAMDGGPAIRTRTHYPLVAEAPNPMTRKVISKPISLGLRVIDGVLTCGEGQRMGIFAAAGGGKSTLLSSILKGCTADVCVLALIGERGREVREFIERDIGPEGRKKAVLVVSTSDRSSMERLKAAYTATAIAEYFRDQGKSVLLMMDSVTRFGRAQREIGLAAGEPPTRRGFPPSVFSELPKLMERAGNSDKGSITALYTVLVEGDDMTEPIADETRSILDGHIVLSRKLAAANHYPAIDVQASVSRVMNAVVDKEHKAAAQALRKILAKYAEVELLVQIGEYKKGADAEADFALGHIQAVNAFLRQGLEEKSSFEETLAALKRSCCKRGPASAYGKGASWRNDSIPCRPCCPFATIGRTPPATPCGWRNAGWYRLVRKWGGGRPSWNATASGGRKKRSGVMPPSWGPAFLWKRWRISGPLWACWPPESRNASKPCARRRSRCGSRNRP